jgi:hypothetical protein
METEKPAADDATRWRERERVWRRKLGRLRLGVEPIEEQLVRYRRVTWALTAVPAGLALMFLTLFTAFGRPDVGLIFDAIILLPIVLVAWADYGLIARRARRYLAERDDYMKAQADVVVAPGASSEHG